MLGKQCCVQFKHCFFWPMSVYPPGQSNESVFVYCLLFTFLSHWAIDCPVGSLCTSKVSCVEKQGCAQVGGTSIPHQQEAATLHYPTVGNGTCLTAVHCPWLTLLQLRLHRCLISTKGKLWTLAFELFKRESISRTLKEARQTCKWPISPLLYSISLKGNFIAAVSVPVVLNLLLN